jgi:hypothetical protein
MTDQKNNIISGDEQKAPGNLDDEKAVEERETGRKDSTRAYDTIAYAVRTDSIKKLIEEFGSRHLTREYTAFAYNLCDKVSLTPDMDILRGHKAIWAASIIHVIARLNFLFESSSELVLTPALISAHFKTNKSTVGNRASQIQKMCGLEPGARGYCRPEIVDAVTFHETVGGIALPPNTTHRSAPEEEVPENPAMRILEYRRRQEEESKKLQALLEEKGDASGSDKHIPQDDKQLKLFE